MGALLERSEWDGWAREWGLAHGPQRGKFIRNEWVAGPHRQYLIRVGWMGEYGNMLYVLIRFPQGRDPVQIREQLLHDPQMAALLPKQRWRKTQTLTVEPTNVLWMRGILGLRPKTEQVRQWVEQLTQAVSRISPAFDGHCEQCGGTGADRYVLYEEVPMYLCSACQQRVVSEGATAERRYKQQEANYLLGALYGTASAAVGGVGWALLALWTDRIYAIVAIGIAWLVAWAYYKGAGKIDQVGRLIAAALTIGGVVIGKVVFYAALIHQAHPEIPFRLEVGWGVFLEVMRQQPGELMAPLLFGLLGVWYVLRFLQQPTFTPKIEQPK